MGYQSWIPSWKEKWEGSYVKRAKKDINDLHIDLGYPLKEIALAMEKSDLQ